MKPVLYLFETTVKKSQNACLQLGVYFLSNTD